MAKVEKLPSGKFRIRWTDPWGRRTSQTFTTAADARAHHHKILGDMARGEYIDRRRARITLADWADDWLLGARNLGQGGRDMYEQALKHILPELGRIPLGKLTATDIDRYLTGSLAGSYGFTGTETTACPVHGLQGAGWTESCRCGAAADVPRSSGLAPSTVHRHYRTLHRMLAVAVERGVIPRNPCEHVHPPRVPRTEMRVLDAGQIDALAAAISPRYRAWVYVAAYGGLRWSETVGLRRGRVLMEGRPPTAATPRAGTSGGKTLDTRMTGASRPSEDMLVRIAVVEQLVRRRDGTWDRTEPKVGSRRTVTLPDFCTDEMAGHLDHYAIEGPDGLMFPTSTGRPMYGGSWTSSIFKRALVKAGLPDIRIHDLRHTAVAMAIATGAHPKAIQERMGHSSIKTTLDVYGHLFPAADEAVAAGLENLRAEAQRNRLRVV
jgi:integrase